MRFALLAGEASGDVLGAALVDALRIRFPQAQFTGITGARMRATGCESLATIDALSVMGLAEVLPKLPAILSLRSRLYRQLRAARPDCVIGIDAPDFNLPLERRLRSAGIRTVHAVSPTVWAWRAGRADHIARSAELLLCLFPFEPDFYARRGSPVNAVFIGHPLAEELAAPPSQAEARGRLKLEGHERIVAMLPGSRTGELQYLAEPFVQTAAWLAAREAGIRFIVPIAKPGLRGALEKAISRHASKAHWTLIDGDSRTAMCAADAVLVASGTATLECLLLERPMVVAYRVSALTAWLLRRLRLLKIERVSLPNLLCSEAVVPEFLQEQAQPAALGAELQKLLNDPAARERQLGQFAAVRATLRRDAAARAAEAIAKLLETQPSNL